VSPRGCSLLWALAGSAAACGRLDFDDHADAPGAGSGACDLSAPFGTPVELASLDPDGGEEGTIRFLPDELTGYYWSSQGQAGAQEPTHLYRVTRPDLASPFTSVAIDSLDVVNLSEIDPSPTPDDTLLLFRRTGSGAGDRIFMALGPGDGTFGSGALVAALHSGTGEEQPFIPLTGDEIYFQSHLNGSGSGDVYRATRTGSAFSDVQLVNVSVDGYEDGDPMLAPNGLDLYFRSDRPAEHAKFNVWMAHRDTISDDFGAAVEVPNINGSANEGPSWMSADGCRLYLSSDRLGVNEPFVATRGD
jgi:Tol biopolymer transport system component